MNVLINMIVVSSMVDGIGDLGGHNGGHAPLRWSSELIRTWGDTGGAAPLMVVRSWSHWRCCSNGEMVVTKLAVPLPRGLPHWWWQSSHHGDAPGLGRGR